jgi:hypothetical protein
MKKAIIWYLSHSNKFCAFLSRQLNRFRACAMSTEGMFTMYSLLRIRGRLISFANQATPLGSFGEDNTTRHERADTDACARDGVRRTCDVSKPTGRRPRNSGSTAQTSFSDAWRWRAPRASGAWPCTETDSCTPIHEKQRHCLQHWEQM